MRVLLVDTDSIWFNLALMKLSTFHKLRGDSVSLFRPKRLHWLKVGKAENLEVKSPAGPYDKVYVSCIFTKNRAKALAIAKMYESLGCEVEVGGSGVSLTKELPFELEHQKPDYSLFELDYSVGFLTRGCIRNCPFCFVFKKEGKIRLHSPLKEFLHPRHRRVMLLDNNLLAHPKHCELLEELIRERLEVAFTQGLDIRLVDDENVKWLRLVQYRDPKFEEPRLYFAWDTLEIEDQVLKGIEILGRHGIPPNHLRFYMLCGFGVKPESYTWNYFIENDWHRFETLSKLGAEPYVMVYNFRRDIPLLTAFGRWVNFAYKAKKKSLGLLESFRTYWRPETVFGEPCSIVAIPS